jgi:hypothetical protein
MKKMELVAQLQAARSLSSQVDIDKVIELINSLDDVKTVTTLSSELIEELSNKIERCLDNNCNDLVNKDDATFSIGYGNVIELDDAEINVYEIMEHINEVLVQFETVEEIENEAVEEIIDGEDVSSQVTVY